MNRRVKINIVLLALIFVIFILSTTVFGTLIDEFENSINPNGADDLKNSGNKILGVIRVVGTIISVGVIMILGVKYMIGSAEEKAEYKKTMLPYLIGAILLFASTSLADVIYTWAKDL